MEHTNYIYFRPLEWENQIEKMGPLFLNVLIENENGIVITWILAM